MPSPHEPLTHGQAKKILKKLDEEFAPALRDALASTQPLFEQMGKARDEAKAILSTKDEGGTISRENLDKCEVLQKELRDLNRQITEVNTRAIEGFQSGILALIDEEIDDSMSAVDADEFREKRMQEILDAIERQKKTLKPTVGLLPPVLQTLMFGQNETTTAGRGTSSSKPNSSPPDTDPSEKSTP